jgi:hypothetical protein
LGITDSGHADLLIDLLSSTDEEVVKAPAIAWLIANGVGEIHPGIRGGDNPVLAETAVSVLSFLTCGRRSCAPEDSRSDRFRPPSPSPGADRCHPESEDSGCVNASAPQDPGLLTEAWALYPLPRPIGAPWCACWPAAAAEVTATNGPLGFWMSRPGNLNDLPSPQPTDSAGFDQRSEQISHD